MVLDPIKLVKELDELSSYGIREFTNIKSVHVKPLEHARGSAVE